MFSRHFIAIFNIQEIHFHIYRRKMSYDWATKKEVPNLIRVICDKPEDWNMGVYGHKYHCHFNPSMEKGSILFKSSLIVWAILFYRSN
jgi:hypothetical protein